MAEIKPRRRPRQSEVDELRSRLAAREGELHSAKTELKFIKEDYGKTLTTFDDLAQVTEAMEPPKPWNIKIDKKGKSKVAAIFLCGDLHTGEVTDPRQVEDFGMFNYEILKARQRRYAEKALKYIEVQRAGYQIDTAYVCILGDTISGDIHDELIRTNDFPPPVQAICAGRVLTNFISSLSAAFSKVVINAVAGSNHARLTKRYQFKGGAINSFDFVSYEHAKALLAKHENVEFNILPAKKQVVNIEGYRVLMAHGDHIKAWLGIPHYGWQRDWAREATRRLEMMQEYLRQDLPIPDAAGLDYGFGAHFHEPWVNRHYRQVHNGAMSGTNEYDHAAGRFAYPSQTTLLISKKHGIFSDVMWRLDDKSDLALAKSHTDEVYRLMGGDE